MTQLIAVVCGPSLKEAKEQIALAQKEGADLVEIRLDRMPDALSDLSKLPQSLPMIFTFRKKSQE